MEPRQAQVALMLSDAFILTAEEIITIVMPCQGKDKKALPEFVAVLAMLGAATAWQTRRLGKEI